MNKHLPLLSRAPGERCRPSPTNPSPDSSHLLRFQLWVLHSHGPAGQHPHRGVPWILVGRLPALGAVGVGSPQASSLLALLCAFQPCNVGSLSLGAWLSPSAPLPGQCFPWWQMGAHLGGTAEPEQALPLCSPRTVLSAPQRSTGQHGDPEPCTAGRCPGSQLCLGHSHQLCSAHTSNAGAFPAPISVQTILLPLGNSARFAL